MSEETSSQLIDTMGPLDKLATADYARLMGDNQRVLDSVNRRAEVFAQWEAKQLGEAMAKAAGAEDMQILIDSPTVTHQYPSPERPQPNGLRNAVTAGLAVAALLGVPGAAAIAWLAKPDPAPIVLPGKTTPDTSVKVGLGKLGDLIPKASP